MAETLLYSSDRNFMLEHKTVEDYGIECLLITSSEEVKGIIDIFLLNADYLIKDQRKLYIECPVRYSIESVPQIRTVEEFKRYTELVNEALTFGIQVNNYISNHPEWIK